MYLPASSPVIHLLVAQPTHFPETLLAMKQKILLVSQDPLLISRATSYFSCRGFDVLGADTGLHGLNQARLALPDIIVLDEDLPDLDSASVCGILRIQLSTRQIPIIRLVNSEKALLSQATNGFTLPRFFPRNLAMDTLRDHVVSHSNSPVQPFSLAAAQ